MFLFRTLDQIESVWDGVLLNLSMYKERYYILQSSDEVYSYLDEHQIILSSLKNSPFYMVFEERISFWINTLSEVLESLDMLWIVQNQWIYLETIFVGASDIKRQLPLEVASFEDINDSWATTMNRLFSVRRALRGLNEHGLFGAIFVFVFIY